MSSASWNVLIYPSIARAFAEVASHAATSFSAPYHFLMYLSTRSRHRPTQHHHAVPLSILGSWHTTQQVRKRSILKGSKDLKKIPWRVPGPVDGCESSAGTAQKPRLRISHSKDGACTRGSHTCWPRTKSNSLRE